MLVEMNFRFYMILFMILKSSPLNGGKKLTVNPQCWQWYGKRHSYIADEGINWHTFSGTLFGNLKLKYRHTLSPSNSVSYNVF